MSSPPDSRSPLSPAPLAADAPSEAAFEVTPSLKAVPAGAAASPASQTEIGNIEYTRTRVVPVSRESLTERKVVVGNARDQASTAFKMLRTQVLRRMQASGWRTLAVVSPAPDDGKTLIAANLAISISRDVHHTALLVDFDLHRPSVHDCFAITPSVGVGDVLRGEAPLEDAFLNPGIPGMTLLPGTGPLDDASELLASTRVTALVDELRERYAGRVVLFDLPPILATDDAIAFLPNVDAVLLVVRDGKHTREQLQRVRRLVSTVPVVGAVLNYVDLRGQPYYYGYY
jgi:capsular exopolysaccharide synthesis family protein